MVSGVVGDGLVSGRACYRLWTIGIGHFHFVSRY